MFFNMYFKEQKNTFRLRKEHKEMESARGPNVGPPARRQVWVAPSPTPVPMPDL